MANEEYNEVKRIEGHQEITEIAFLKPIARDKDTMTYQICIIHTYLLFRNKRFELNKMFQQNASKFAIFFV